MRYTGTYQWIANIPLTGQPFANQLPPRNRPYNVISARLSAIPRRNPRAFKRALRIIVQGL